MGKSAVMFSFDTHVDKFISQALQDGYWFDKDWMRLCELYRGHDGASFLDVGANIGVFTVPMSRCLHHMNSTGEAGPVIAVEALPVNVLMLKANLEVNAITDAIVYPVAVSANSSGGELVMRIHPENRGHSSVLPIHSIDRALGDNSTGRYFQAVVPTMTIDQIYRERPEAMRVVLVMKIDIEGLEGQALRGSARFLSEAPPCYIKIELWEDLLWKAGTPYLDVVDMLRSVGYIEARTQEGMDHFFEQRELAACIATKSRHARNRSMSGPR